MTFMTLTQRVEREKGKRPASEVRQMNLDHCKSTSMDGLSEDFVNLTLLSLVGAGLESLAGMPKLPSLKILELTNNSISGGLEVLVNCPALEQLNLTSNKISTVEALTPLAKLSYLRSLDLFECEITQIENYRKMVFAALPNLKYLDGFDENNESEQLLVPNGDAYDDEEDEDDSDDNDTDDDEEYGIEALQRSEDLEDDDEEDYAPGEEEEAELDEYDDLDDEEDEEEVEDDGANLSGAGVTGPRRASSKRHRVAADNTSDTDETEPVAKHKVNDDGEAHDQ